MLQVRSYKYLMIQMVTVTDKKSIVDRPLSSRCLSLFTIHLNNGTVTLVNLIVSTSHKVQRKLELTNLVRNQILYVTYF